MKNVQGKLGFNEVITFTITFGNNEKGGVHDE